MLTWDTSCLDWKERLLSGRSLVPDLPLFEDEAARALRVFKRLRIPDLIGRPTMGEMAGPWLFPIVEAIFGSYDPDIHRRMIQEFFWLIPKKNAKTSTAAAIMVEALILNYRPEAEYVLIAPTKDIADRSFNQAQNTIRADVELDKVFQVQRHLRTIQHRLSGAMLQVKAADTDIVTGGKQVGTLVDEIHQLGSKKDAADIMLELRGALTARPDGFLVTITTQSKKPPAGIFKTELQNARDVRDGKLKLPLLPILYELPHELARDGGWKERKYWGLVNPNLRRSVDEAFLEQQLSKVEKGDAGALALFASQHFNVEIGLALQSDRWAGADFWEAQGDPTLTLESLLERCEVAVIAVDGGGLDDLLALNVTGREKHSRRWLSWNKTWVHRSVLDLRQSEASRLLDFEAAGELVIVDDMQMAFEDLAQTAAQVKASGILAEKNAVGMDPMGVGLIVEALAEEGIENVEGQPLVVIGISQGWKLNGAIKTSEVKLSSHELVHAGQAICAWAVGNAKVVPQGNAITITKQAAGTAKIDPLMALFIATALMSMNPAATPKYDVFFV
ncbi:MAG TPA: terminase large subunit [Alphaproteobacteria bacterium]|jgi:phage terminase large subunit-like protein